MRLHDCEGNAVGQSKFRVGNIVYRNSTQGYITDRVTDVFVTGSSRKVEFTYETAGMRATGDKNPIEEHMLYKDKTVMMNALDDKMIDYSKMGQ